MVWTALQVRVGVLVLGLVLSSCQTVSSTRVPTDVTRVAVAGLSVPDQFVVGEQTFRVPDFVGNRGAEEVARKLIGADLGRVARRWSVVKLSDRNLMSDLEVMLGRMDDGSDRSTRSVGGLPRVFVDSVLNSTHPQHGETVSALALAATRAGVDGVIVMELRSEPLLTEAQQNGYVNACVFTAAMVQKSGQVIDLSPLHNRWRPRWVDVFTGEVSVSNPRALAQHLDGSFKLMVAQWMEGLGFISQSRR